MKDWYEALESREQSMVLICAAVVAVALLYAVVWMPIIEKRDDVRADVEIWQQSLAELKPLRGQLGSSTRPNPADSSRAQQSPLTVVDQTLKTRGLDRYLQTTQPTTRNGIRVVFENVAFDDLIVWLGVLGEEYAMHVQAGSFAAGSQADDGRINATLTLERAP